MPSRKKAKGKARKAAKEAKSKATKEEESRAAMEVAADQQQMQDSVEAQMQRLRVSDSSPTICGHGLVPPSADEEKIFEDFMNAFIAAFCSQQTVGPAFFTAYHATKEKYADVYASKLDTAISILLCNGTQCILDGNNRQAQLYACIASFCEDVTSDKQSIPCCATVELESADDHTLVSYYRKRTPCACLDEKYKKVKSLKKMGLCCNPSCSHPKGKVERSKMFSCTRCGEVNYCSSECQRAEWKKHKQICGNVAEAKAAFNK